jgi:hypothetical protein
MANDSGCENFGDAVHLKNLRPQALHERAKFVLDRAHSLVAAFNVSYSFARFIKQLGGCVIWTLNFVKDRRYTRERFSPR